MQSDLLSNFTSSTDDVIALIYNNVNQTTETQPLDFHPCDIDDRNTNFNCSAEEYLRFYRGPQTLPLIIVLPVSDDFIRSSHSPQQHTQKSPKWQNFQFSIVFHIPQVTILYVGVFIGGIVGNVIVCVVIIRHSSMHTATNYYLFSLAVSDLIYLMFGEFHVCSSVVVVVCRV